MGGASNTGFYIWALKDWSQRDRSQAAIQAEIQGILDGAPGVQGYAFSPPSLPGPGVVPYTHIELYKRQFWASAMPSGAAMARCWKKTWRWPTTAWT